MTSDYQDCVARLLSQEAQQPPDRPVTADTLLGDSGLAVNSIGLVRVFISLEDLLEIELDDAVIMASELRTVGDVVEVVRTCADRPRTVR